MLNERDTTITERLGTVPSLEEMQHWTRILGRAQQMITEFAVDQMLKLEPGADGTMPQLPAAWSGPIPISDPARIAGAQADFWLDSMKLWQRFLFGGGAADVDSAPDPAAQAADRDRRFSAPQWRDNPVFDLIRQSYLLVVDHMLRGVDAVEGIDDRQREQIRFATRAFADAMSPSNFPLTNPLVLEKTFEMRGENLLRGLDNMLADLGKGQLTHADSSKFELGRNIAATPGKVVRETPLYQLLHYAPTTPSVYAVPLLIFPPWINRFYILDLSPEKSFIKWAVDQGLSVFVVSWKSADSSMADVTWDDYVMRGQIDAIDAVRNLLKVDSVHTVGYCVAGTTLAATLALLATRGEAAKVASATFFTAQVDFSEAGDLNLFITDEQMKLISALSDNSGYLDGRYMAATFNLLRARDLVWNYVVNNYMLGQDYPPFDLLHWNGDTTNLPARWHRSYLEDLYRDNRLVSPGAIYIDGTPIDLTTVKTPSYVQAGREDHIAPPESVWKITGHFQGPLRFVLAGSGHIAGVVNPPSSGKYQYWTNEKDAADLPSFIAGATETKGSWWPDWLRWITGIAPDQVKAAGPRKPARKLEDAPGSYVRMR